MGKLLDYCKSKIGCGYVWGSQGEILTEDLLKKWIKENGEQFYHLKDGTKADKWLGKQVFDCSGLIVAGLKELAGFNGDLTAEDLYNLCTHVGRNELLEGDLVFIKVGSHIDHVGIYAGNGETVEAYGTKYGVIIGDLNDFNLYGRLTIKIPNDTMSDTEMIVQELLKRNVIKSPQYWRQNLLPGKTVSADYVIKLLKPLLGV